MMKKMIALIAALILMIPFALAEDMEAPEVFTIYPPVAAHAQFALPGNATTGYRWTAFLLKDGVVELVNPDGDYVADEAEEGMVGVGGTHYFEITAVAPGETILLLNYFRPSDPTDMVTRAYLIQVDEDGTLYIRDLEGAAPIIGQVVEIDEENHSALLNTETHGEVLAFFGEDMPLPTLEENVKIWFNGAMTMSIPAQIGVIAWETIAPPQARPMVR